MAITLLKTHVIQRVSGCDVWPVMDDGKGGREFKLWKSGHDLKKDGAVAEKWCTYAIQKILDLETAEAAELDTIKAEVEPAKIDALLSFAKANPETCAAELEALARKKVEGI